MITQKVEHPFQGSRAAKLLSAAIHRNQAEGVSLRKLAQRLHYKQPVVLSHMASGRVPIPIDRVSDLVRVLDMPGNPFLFAVLEQRHPLIPWESLLGSYNAATASQAELIWSLEKASGVGVDDLNDEQLRVMREVAATPDAARRWLSIHEAPIIDALRKARPNLGEVGADSSEVAWMASVLEI